MADQVPEKPAVRRRRALWLRSLGPGLVSGVADDDPSGIATYSQAGAQLGYAACGILVLCYPLMVATQEISARIGRATGGGLIALLRRHHAPSVTWTTVTLVVVANVINLGADLGAMADALHLLFGGPSLAYVALCGTGCAGLLLRLRLRRYIQVVKWGGLSLLTYIFAAIQLPHPWGSVLYHSLVPGLALTRSSVAIFAAVMGTTISPYLFIWQSSLEAERARDLPPLQPGDPDGLAAQEVSRIRLDTCAGMAVAAVVAYAVILTTASALHGHGITNIQTSAQAADALRPFAGRLAYGLFAAGILATGFFAVPMLAGSTAFAIAEAMGWRVGLAQGTLRAPAFPLGILAATAAGIAMNLARLDPIAALLWSAVINGLLCTPLIIVMMLAVSRRDVMGPLKVPSVLLALGWIAALVMGATFLGFLVTLGE